MNVSPLMQALRDRLDSFDIPWIDTSEAFDGFIFERTEIVKSLESCYQASVVYIYEINDNIGFSKGFPDKLECWCRDYDPDPMPMTVDEVIMALGWCV